MCRLRIGLDLRFPRSTQEELDRLGLFTRQLALPDELLLPSMGLELRPSVFLPVRNIVSGTGSCEQGVSGYRAEEQPAE